MRAILISILLSFACIGGATAQQTLNKAKALYTEGNYAEALPLFESEYNLKPTNASIAHWYGVCLVETDGDLEKAEELLIAASKRRVRDSFLYLGKIYTEQFRFSEAKEMYDQYEKHLKKRGEDAEKAELEVLRAEVSRMNRIVSHTEDIRIIDSLVVDKSRFLLAYKMSRSTGKLEYFNKVFASKSHIESTVYFNEKETKIYYSRPLSDSTNYSLFSMDKLIDGYKNEKPLSANNFGLKGNVNYPFIMTDGVTIYFAAEDEGTMGGYDLFVSRYNMNNDTYLNPERLNMPFNSKFNDYMMVVDEDKHVGWFASDRFQPEGKVCVYTFIPNDIVRVVESDDELYLANRAQVRSIQSSWREGEDYSKQIETAREEVATVQEQKRDFEFVVNDNLTYFSLNHFRNQASREAYAQVVQLKKELATLSAKLDKDREVYSKANHEEKLRMSAAILDEERRMEHLLKEIPSLEIKARNLEIESMQ